MSQKGSSSIGASATPGAVAADVDELFEVKTYFYIGAYQQCLNEIQKLARVSVEMVPY